MHYKRNKWDNAISLKFGKHDINQVASVKFLGVWIDTSLKWESHIDYIKKKISSGLYALRSLRNLIPKSILRTLYFSLIESHLQYGLTVWGGTYNYLLNQLKIQQKRALTIIDKKTYNYPSSELFSNL